MGSAPEQKLALEKKLAEQRKRFQLVASNRQEHEVREKRAEAAKRAAESARQAEAEEEQEEDVGEGKEEEEQLQLEGAVAAMREEEPEPAVFDAHIFVPQKATTSLEGLDYTALRLPAQMEQQDRALAYQELLTQRAVLFFAGGPSPQILQLLFTTTTAPGLASVSHQASQELAGYYANLKPDEDPAWAPSLQDFYEAMCRLGYRGAPGHSADTSQPIDVDDPSRASAGPSSTTAPSTDMAGLAAGLDSGRCLDSLKNSLDLLAKLCSVHEKRAQGLFDCTSGPAQVATVRLTTALLELQLAPQVANSTAMLGLSACLDALVACWGHRRSSSNEQASTSSHTASAAPGGSTEDEEALWQQIALKVARNVPCIGPCHSARAYATSQLLQPGAGYAHRKLMLQQLMALQLMADVASSWKAQEPLRLPHSQQDLLAAPLRILKSLSPNAKDLCSSVQLPGKETPDFAALHTLFDCTATVLRPLTSQSNQVLEEHQASAARDMSDYLTVVTNGLNKTRNERAVSLCTLLSKIKNSLEFGMGGHEVGVSRNE